MLVRGLARDGLYGTMTKAMETSLPMPETARHGFTTNARWILLWSAIAGLATATSYQMLPNYLEAVGFESSDILRLSSWPAVVATLTALPAGVLAHRAGAKRLLLLGVCLMFGTMIASAATTSIGWSKWLLIARTVGGTTIAVASVPLMAENSAGYQRVRLFCYAAGLSLLAYVFGPYLYVKTLHGAMAVLKLESINLTAHRIAQAFLAVVLLVSVVPLSRIKRLDQWNTYSDGSSYEALFQRPVRLARLFAPLVPIQFGSCLVSFFMFLFYADRFAADSASLITPLLLRSLGAGILAFALPAFSRRLSPERLTLILVLLALVGLGAMGFAPSVGWSKLGFFLRGILMGLAAPLFTVIILDRLPSRQWPVASAMLVVAWPNSMIAPLLGSLIRIKSGYDTLIGVVMACYLLAAILIWLLIHRRPRDVQTEAIQLHSDI